MGVCEEGSQSDESGGVDVLRWFDVLTDYACELGSCFKQICINLFLASTSVLFICASIWILHEIWS